MLRKILKWALMRKVIPKIYINVIENTYDGSCNSVKSMCGEKEDFGVRIGVH